jgi:hypothetical protein
MGSESQWVAATIGSGRLRKGLLQRNGESSGNRAVRDECPWELSPTRAKLLPPRDRNDWHRGRA